jgi:hypothetical protein
MRAKLALLFLCSSAVFAQRFSIGVKGGVPITGAFSNTTTTGVDVVTRTFSESNQYIIGPTVELHLPLGLSVEADGLYHPLNFAMENRVIPLGTFRSVTNISSWEFPILGKYRSPIPLVKPFVELGPNFRHVGGNRTYFSNTGLTMGVGIELRLGKLRMGPEVRYTRWGSDASPGRGVASFPPSNLNQSVFLIGISY